jgi:hypothetical protein
MNSAGDILQGLADSILKMLDSDFRKDNDDETKIIKHYNN